MIKSVGDLIDSNFESSYGRIGCFFSKRRKYPTAVKTGGNRAGRCDRPEPRFQQWTKIALLKLSESPFKNTIKATLGPLDFVKKLPPVLTALKRGGTPDRNRLTDAQMLAVIRTIHTELKGAYGSPRMVRELRLRGFTAGKARVERLMRENGIRARHKRRYKVTTNSKHGLPVAANLLDRNFTPAAPNKVWSADISYPWTDEGWLYLAIVLDLFNREVIGWSLKLRMTTDLVTDTLTMAWFRRRPGPGVVHHSDRGSQYASHAFQEKLKEFGMTCSMSRKGNWWASEHCSDAHH